MCGRYTLFTPSEKLAERFDAKLPDMRIDPRYNAAPSQTMPIITEENGHQMVLAHWGYPIHVGGKHKELINLRAESIFGKPWFKSKAESHRCLVLADGFYEWQAQPGVRKQPYHIGLTSHEPFAFAGVYQDPDDEKGLPYYAILTVPPNSLMKSIHNRMPAILEKEHERDWLDENRTLDDLENLIVPYKGDNLATYPVSTIVNDTSHDAPELLIALRTNEDLSRRFSKKHRDS